VDVTAWRRALAVTRPEGDQRIGEVEALLAAAQPRAE
jgi:hypothetical protein